jgi:hypothetical protein
MEAIIHFKTALIENTPYTRKWPGTGWGPRKLPK